MKRIIRNFGIIACITGSVILTSCKDNNTENDQQDGMEMSEDKELDVQNDATQMGMVNNIKFKEEKMATLFEHYDGVKKALVDTDAENAAKHAEELSAASDGAVKAAAAKIAEASDVNVQREAFSELTKAMEPVLEGSLENGKIYKQFCPMAFEGKGDYWYSDSEEIRNPYFGDKMLKCGRVEETIQ